MVNPKDRQYPNLVKGRYFKNDTKPQPDQSSKGEQMSSILDDAREKIARQLYEDWNQDYEKPSMWPIVWGDLPDYRKQSYLDWVDEYALSLSGTTDIECPGCKGDTRMFSGNYHCSHCGKAFQIAEQAEFIAHQSDCDYVCPKCDNGVIKHKWKIADFAKYRQVVE